jgi:hypothetical protein
MSKLWTYLAVFRLNGIYRNSLGTAETRWIILSRFFLILRSTVILLFDAMKYSYRNRRETMHRKIVPVYVASPIGTLTCLRASLRGLLMHKATYDRRRFISKRFNAIVLKICDTAIP